MCFGTGETPLSRAITTSKGEKGQTSFDNKRSFCAKRREKGCAKRKINWNSGGRKEAFEHILSLFVYG